MQKLLVGGDSLYLKFWIKVTALVQNRRFSIYFRSQRLSRNTCVKVCYKVSFRENCQRQSCKAFIGLTIGAKMIGGGRPLIPEILSQRDRVVAKSHLTSFLLARRRYYRLSLLPIMSQWLKTDV